MDRRPDHGLLFMVSIALVDARKTSLTGVQNSKKNRLAASRLVDDAPHRRWVKPPPWKKARSAPVLCGTLIIHIVSGMAAQQPFLSPSKFCHCTQPIVSLL